MASRHDSARLLREWANGTQSALEVLTPLVYQQLRRLSASYLRSESPGHTLQPTAPVHEAFLRLAGRSPDCENPSQFYGVAAHPMRQILIDYARTRQTVQRCGRVEAYMLDGDLVAMPISLQSMRRWSSLAELDPRKALVEMPFFGGPSVQESVEVLDGSEVTVRRDCQSAKTWLLRELRREMGDGT